MLKRQSVKASETPVDDDSEATAGMIAVLATRPEVDLKEPLWCSTISKVVRHSQRRSGRTASPSRGLRMTDALDEVRESIQRNLDEKKGGSRKSNSGRLADCIDRGLDEVRAEQETIRDYVKDIEKVAATLEPGTADCANRQEKFEKLIDQFERTEDPIRQHMATVMISFLAGLFVGRW